MEKNIMNTYEKAKMKKLEEAIQIYKTTKRGMAKILTLLKPIIIQMKQDGLSLKEQIEILEDIIGTEIKYTAYQKWTYRYIKNIVVERTELASNAKTPLQQRLTPLKGEKSLKTQNKEQKEQNQKKEVRDDTNVSIEEQMNNDVSIDDFLPDIYK